MVLIKKRQEAFNRVIAHLIQQGHPCVWMDPSRDRLGPSMMNPNGDLCAIGCLIPQNITIKPEWNFLNLWEPYHGYAELDEELSRRSFTKEVLEAIGLPGEYVFCSQLQNIHDLSWIYKDKEFIRAVIRRARTMVARWSLNHTKLLEVMRDNPSDTI